MTQPPSPARPARRRPAPGFGRGFTLVELLVVIGIIVLLISILLPVVGRVKTSAQTAATWARMSAIAAAIERYHADERSYPGLFSNAQLSGGLALTYSPAVAGGGTELTSSENLVGSLVGGFEASSGTGAPDSANLSTTTTIGKGPLSFALSVVNRKRRPAYLDVGPGNMLPQAPFSTFGLAATNPEAIGTPPGTADSGFPEFQDAYSYPRSLIYLRANAAATGDMCTPMATKALASPTQKYSTYELNYYQRGAAGDFPGDFKWGDATNDFYNSELEYIGNPQTLDKTSTATMKTSAPRGQDKYILISAGPDRIFGTKDDLFYGGN